MNATASAKVAARLAEVAGALDPGEVDNLKYRLSIAATSKFSTRFELPTDAHGVQGVSSTLRTLLSIQPYGHRVPPYGIAYHGRPDFLDSALLARLQSEAASMRLSARLNLEQLITRVETPQNDSEAERLANSEVLLELVRDHAGPCRPSYVTSYLYYEANGHCSRPHVDNAFTAVTAMVGLQHERPRLEAGSFSVFYWPDRPPLAVRLQPGEMLIFFGACVLHGRTPVEPGEKVHSLLLSFKPDIESF